MQNPIQHTLFAKLTRLASLGLGALSGLYGGFDFLLKTLLILMAVDYLSGLLCAAMGKSRKTPDGKLSSDQGAKGLLKKAMIMLSVLVSVVLDEALGQKNMFRNACILFYSANEMLSFIENLGLMGLPFPDVLKNAISKLGEKQDREKSNR